MDQGLVAVCLSGDNKIRDVKKSRFVLCIPTVESPILLTKGGNVNQIKQQMNKSLLNRMYKNVHRGSCERRVSGFHSKEKVLNTHSRF